MKDLGGAARIHAARAKKLKVELDRIEAALDRVGIAAGDDLAVADRVEAALVELASLRRKVEDMQWERA